MFRFLLARLFIQSLKYKSNMSDIPNSIQGFPANITMQYQETWQRIEQQEFDHSSLAKRILSWLAHTVRPLSIQELCHALAIKCGDKATNMRNLDAADLFVPCYQDLVVVEKGSQVIGLVHHTAQQYLDAHRSILFLDSEAKILQTCLTYLSFSEFDQGSCLFDSLKQYDVNEVANGKRIARKRFLPYRLSSFPFLSYAAANWGQHAIGQNAITHKEQILVFLQNPMLLESAAQV